MSAQEQKLKQNTIGAWATGSLDLSWSLVYIQNVESTGHQTHPESLVLPGITLGSLASCVLKIRHIHSTKNYHAPPITLVHNLKFFK